MNGDDLEREFAARGIRRGGSLMLPAADALALVRRARAERVPVLGIDGFHLGPASTEPDPAHVLDLSGASSPTDPWSEAESFLGSRLESGMHFEVVAGRAPARPLRPRRPRHRGALRKLRPTGILSGPRVPLIGAGVRPPGPARRPTHGRARGHSHPEEEAMEAELQKEQRWLERLVGEWTSEMEAAMKPGDPPQTFTGTESVRSLDGVWVLCEGRPSGGSSTTVMTLGYDTAKQRYVGTFIGSMSTYMWIYEGSVDDSGNALTLETEGPSFTDESRMAKYRDTIEFRSEDHRVLTSRCQGEDGSWEQIMEVHYRRTT